MKKNEAILMAIRSLQYMHVNYISTSITYPHSDEMREINIKQADACNEAIEILLNLLNMEEVKSDTEPNEE